MTINIRSPSLCYMYVLIKFMKLSHHLMINPLLDTLIYVNDMTTQTPDLLVT